MSNRLKKWILMALISLGAGSAMAEDTGLITVEPQAAGFRPELLDLIGPMVEGERAAGQFAGCVVAIGRGGKLAMLEAYGHRQLEPAQQEMTVDTVFDMASLTKPVAAGTSIMKLCEQGGLSLEDLARTRLPGLVGEGSETITIEHLLTHHAGYVPDNSLEDYKHGVDEAWRRLLTLKTQTPPGTRFKYSDVGFELLGKIVEEVSGRPLDQFAREEVFEPIGMADTGYLPDEARRSRAAASEPRDGVMLVGEVHDPRAALLGGVAGHAGLFSTAKDMARYATMMLGGGQIGGVRVLDEETVDEMTRARDVSGQRRAAGWDAQSAYSSNRGKLLSDRAFGHGGFTGTAMWIDPELDLFVIVLSNRLHPDGKGNVNPLAGRIGTVAAAALLVP